MRWEGRERSKNVIDSRGKKAAAGAVGGGGLLAVILAVVFVLMRGGDGKQAFDAAANQLRQQAAVQAAQGGNVQPGSPEEEQALAFVEVVLKDTEDVWNQLLPQTFGKQYQEPKLVVFRDVVDSACGQASSAVGPFYCPGDNQVYLDLGFFTELQTKFKAPGDFACAYVVAHEVGHHIQNLLGLSMDVQRRQARMSKVEANQESVRLELQADFLAGVWAHHAQRTKQILEEGDIGEAINAASRIGDDTLQREATGRVRPDGFTHGTSAQRIYWFKEGLRTGDLNRMNETFELNYDAL